MTLGIPCHCSEDGAMQIAGNGASEPAPCLRVGGSVSGGEMQSIPSGDTERPVLGRVRLEERCSAVFDIPEGSPVGKWVDCPFFACIFRKI